jgi:hypothetical protein
MQIEEVLKLPGIPKPGHSAKKDKSDGRENSSLKKASGGQTGMGGQGAEQIASRDILTQGVAGSQLHANHINIYVGNHGPTPPPSGIGGGGGGQSSEGLRLDVPPPTEVHREGNLEIASTRVAVKSEVEPKPPPTNGSQKKRHLDSQFVQQAQDAICHILEGCLALKAAIEHELTTRPGYTGQQGLVTALETRECLSTVVNDILRPATIACLQNLHQAGDEFRHHWEAAREVLAWLCVLAVKPEWVADVEQDANGFAGISFEIPVKTDAGVEILCSRYRQRKPTFSKETGKSDIPGENCFVVPLVTGSFAINKVLHEFLVTIWNQVIPCDKRAITSVLSKDEIGFLDAVLDVREENKEEHHYLAFSPGKNTALDNEIFLAELLSKLPHLVVIRKITSSGSSPLLVSNELKLLAVIISFFKIPTHLSKKL